MGEPLEISHPCDTICSGHFFTVFSILIIYCTELDFTAQFENLVVQTLYEGKVGTKTASPDCPDFILEFFVVVVMLFFVCLFKKTGITNL